MKTCNRFEDLAAVKMSVLVVGFVAPSSKNKWLSIQKTTINRLCSI
jgi:hypothetical protein